MTDQDTNKEPEPPSTWRQKWRRWHSFFRRNENPNTCVDNRSSLIEAIRSSHKDGIIAEDSLGMIEGVMQIDNLQTRDIMIARTQITFIQRDNSYREILKQVLKSGHSRYPVIDESHDDIDGILHVKDLLKYIGCEESFKIDDILRKANHVPESQRLNHLLTRFRKSRNHMAIVIDEYGSVSGLVTIEDILEQIVGDIDDEYDVEEKPNIQGRKDNIFTINALTPVAEFNEYFASNLTTDLMDTIGGLVTHKIGKIPQQGELLTTNDFEFKVLSSDGRRIQLLEVQPSKKIVTDENLEKKVA